jgi:deoxyribodipyrimidine photolyase-like uncharacterized protein
MRRKHRVLLDAAGEPEGGQWNFDPENRGSFDRAGPPPHRAPVAFPPDAITREVLALVTRRFAAHPGKLEAFDWPLTPAQAQAALDDFIAHRLPEFGLYQDAMWTGEPWLFHARLAAAMNVKLIDPLTIVRAAEAAWRAGRVPLAAAEGFIRQILGWREYVRGVYWLHMPGYLERNELGAREPLPEFFWTGNCSMTCLRESIGQTLTLGYAHHIQRLMVTGLYTLMLGVDPRRVHEWYLAVYVDAVEWVELPELPRHVAVRRRRRDGLEALRGDGKIHPADEQLLRGLPLRPREGDGEERVSVHDLVLGLPAAARATAREKSAHGSPGPQPHATTSGGADRDCDPRHGDPPRGRSTSCAG